MAQWSGAIRLQGMTRLCSILSLLLFLTRMDPCAAASKDFSERGVIKNAWPEYLWKNVTQVREELEAQGVRVFVEAPRDGSPPFFPGEPQDVWLYTDGGDTIVSIPVRGTWHFNRVQPGWPDLVGKPYKEAAATIIAEQIGVEVVYGPEGFPRIENIDYRRVFLDVAKDGSVAIVPRLG